MPPTPTALTNLIHALRQDSPLGHWSDGEQAADTIETLTRLLAGVMADDPPSIREAAHWLNDHQIPNWGHQ